MDLSRFTFRFCNFGNDDKRIFYIATATPTDIIHVTKYIHEDNDNTDSVSRPIETYVSNEAWQLIYKNCKYNNVSNSLSNLFQVRDDFNTEFTICDNKESRDFLDTVKRFPSLLSVSEIAIKLSHYFEAAQSDDNELRNTAKLLLKNYLIPTKTGGNINLPHTVPHARNIIAAMAKFHHSEFVKHANADGWWLGKRVELGSDRWEDADKEIVTWAINRPFAAAMEIALMGQCLRKVWLTGGKDFADRFLGGQFCCSARAIRRQAMKNSGQLKFGLAAG